MRPVAYLGLSKLYKTGPLVDKGWDIWTCNHGCDMFANRNLKVVFDMHDWEKSDYYPKYYETLKQKLNYKVIKPHKDKNVPRCEVFPLEDARYIFGDYFSSTPSYVVAYAYLNRVRDLFMWGNNNLEFIQHPEYGWSFWNVVGTARANGMRIHFVTYALHDEPIPYGYLPFHYDSVKINNPDAYVRKDK